MEHHEESESCRRYFITTQRMGLCLVIDDCYCFLFMVNRMTAQKYREKRDKSKRGCRVQIISYILKEQINQKYSPF